MGLRRFLAAGSDCVEIVFLEVKIGRKIVSDLYTELYTFRQEHLERRMDKGFSVGWWIVESTFNPFVVGSTPAGPTKYKKHFVLRFKVLFSCPFVFDAALAASLVDHARVFYAAAFSTLCDPSLASECITQPKKCRTGQVRHREIGTVLFTALSMWLLRA